MKKIIYLPIYKQRKIFYLPKQIKLKCLPFSSNNIINKYYIINTYDDFLYTEIYNKQNISLNIIFDLQKYLWNIISFSIDQINNRKYSIYSIYIKLYFNTELFSNIAKRFYFINNNNNKIDILLYFINEIKNLIEIYKITNIYKVHIKIIYE